jgi:hypothetical protein
MFMHLKKFFLIVLFFISAINSIYSQQIYREAYIVKTNGDTLSGLILFEKSSIPLQKIVFKRFDIAVPITYTNNEINAYGYKNATSFELKKIDDQNLFLECYVKGRISLFAHGKKFYIEKGDSVFVELKNSSSIYYGTNSTIDFVNYTEVLNYFTLDAPEFKVPEALFLIEPELVKVVEGYNTTFSQDFKTFNRQLTQDVYDEANMLSGKRVKHYGIITSLDLSTTSASHYGRYTNNLDDLNNSNRNWCIGFFINNQIFRYSKNFVYQIEAHYTRGSNYFYSESYRTIYPNETYRIDVNTDFSSLKIPILIQYNIPLKYKLSPYTNLGLSVVHYFSENKKGYLEVQTTQNNIFSFNNIKLDGPNSSTLLNMFISFGVSYKLVGRGLFFVESRVEYSPKSSNLIDFNSSTSYNRYPTITIKEKPYHINLMLGFGF